MIEKFISGITVPEGIGKLKGESNIYLYGNADYAHKVKSVLNYFKISIEGIIVGKEYMPDEITSGGVFQYEDVAENFAEMVIVIGFTVSAHLDVIMKLLKNDNVKTIYILNGILTLSQNEWKFINNPKIYLIDDYYNTFMKRKLNYEYLLENEQKFIETYEWLEDEKSKYIMLQYLKGHVELKNFPFREIWKEENVDTQYFPQDIINLRYDEVFLDVGGYTGDTLEIFLKNTSSFSKYYVMEPDASVIGNLEWTIMKSGASERICHIAKGAWNESSTLYFGIGNGCGTVMASQDNAKVKIDVDKIDNVLPENEKLTFVKMDIEGSELNALQGGKEVIAKCLPTLAICVYHKREDLITIPQFIKSISSDYKLYLRPHRPYVGELVLYAVRD